MKLTTKFFCTAYIIVLLTTGTVGVIMTQTLSSSLWDARVNEAETAKKYAVNGFVSMSEMYFPKMSDKDISHIQEQINDMIGLNTTRSEIKLEDEVDKNSKELKVNEGSTSFNSDGNMLVMESICHIKVNSESYFIVVKSDFTDIQVQLNKMWLAYIFVTLVFAIFGGAILYLVAVKITKPINLLADAADSISKGSYGEVVDSPGNEAEIVRLTESFNSMSSTIKKSIEDIEIEYKKRETFLSDFTHEMKTPMTAIIGYSEMLEKYDLDVNETKEASKAIYNEAKRLESLSLQMLDIFVLQNTDTEFETFLLSDISGQLDSTLHFLAEKYDMTYKIDFSDSCVVANKVLFISLIYNLVDNAFKASSAGDNVEIFSRECGNEVTVCVKDNGKGIKQEHIERLEDPFYREDKSRSRQQGGAGLGLSICQKIAAIHGTKLKFKSEYKVGTVVSFKLKKDGEYNE